jgi:hypothetical protein
MCYILAKTTPFRVTASCSEHPFVIPQNAQDQKSNRFATTPVVTSKELSGVATPFLVAFALYLIVLESFSTAKWRFGAEKA